MHYIIHISTAYQSFKAQKRDIQELIWTRTQRHCRIKLPNHPIVSTTLDQYLSKQTPDIAYITPLLKTKMALTPEFGHIIAVGQSLIDNNPAPRVKVEIADTAKHEKELIQTLWKNLGTLIKNYRTPTFITWNGLDFTFPFLIERSTALGLEPSCVLPRVRFQPWKHMDLLAELGNYNHHRYMNLQSRLTLWGITLNGNGRETNLKEPETLVEQWQKGNPKPLQENLTFTLDAIHQIFKKVAPYLLDTRINN